MTAKVAQSVPLSKAEAAQVQRVARERGISEDEAATLLTQAGLAGIAKPKRKAGKVIGIKRKGRA